MWLSKALALVAVFVGAAVAGKALISWLPWADWLALDLAIMFGATLFAFRFLFPEPPVVCKYCGAEQPRLRRYRARDKEQARWHWTDCPGCGREINMYGEQAVRFPQR